MPDMVPILINDLAEQTTAADSDYMVIGGTDAKKIKWSTIASLIKSKLGIGTASNLTTTSKEIVGAINEVNSSMRTNKILWTGSMYMGEGHKATLSEPISKQKNGIVLEFQPYLNGSATGYYLNAFFIPKAYAYDGVTYAFFITGSKYGHSPATKTIRIYDGELTGHADNTASGTNYGMQYNNSNWVLTRVIGV